MKLSFLCMIVPVWKVLSALQGTHKNNFNTFCFVFVPIQHSAEMREYWRLEKRKQRAQAKVKAGEFNYV
jgi:hypothetical protein